MAEIVKSSTDFRAVDVTAGTLTQAEVLALSAANPDMLFIAKGYQAKGGNVIVQTSEGQEAGTEFYTISTQTHSGYNILIQPPKTIIEGITPEQLTALHDSDKYRMALMRWRKPCGQSPRWVIPMLPYVDGRENITSTLSEDKTWWPITSASMYWWHGGKYVINSVLALSLNNLGTRFKNTRNKKMRVGCAIFKKEENAGGAGWRRVSNISYITLYVNTDGEIMLSRTP